MWVIVMFDLPTETKKERQDYARFRKALLEGGFSMMQFSVYIRHCASEENACVHSERTKQALPPEGEVCLLAITDKQFGKIQVFYGKKRKPTKPAPLQMELF